MRPPLLLLALLALIAAACDGTPPANQAAASDATVGLPPGVSPPAHPKPRRAETVPAAFHGLWDIAAAACAGPSEYRLAVSARELRFHESAGIVRSVTIDTRRGIHVAADYQGEGESWSAVRKLRLSEDGGRLTVSGDGTELVRVRCAASRWEAAMSGEGAALLLTHRGGEPILTLFCAAGSGDLIVNVPAFRPVGSEERMSFGGGGTVVTLVADPRGDRRRGGVSGRGPLPAELAAILAGPAGVAVNYGAQTGGPHATPPAGLARDFLAACQPR